MFLLSLVIFFPLLGGIALLFLPSNWLGAIRWTALGIAGVEFILSSVMALLAIQSSITLFSNSSIGGHLTWISAYGINYSLDVDGISLLLVLLTSLLTCICIAASFQIESKVKQYMAFMLLLECGILGVFLSSNLFLFYIFWEVMLIPAYFLVGSWGGERRIYAAIKFVLYTSVGSLLMLAGIIALGYYHQQAAGGGYTLDLATLLSGGLSS